MKKKQMCEDPYLSFHQKVRRFFVIYRSLQSLSFHQGVCRFFIIYHSLQSFERHINLVGTNTGLRSPPINDYLSQQIKQPISLFLLINKNQGAKPLSSIIVCLKRTTIMFLWWTIRALATSHLNDEC